jgi:alkyl sulfatase BDS1-like metallo-beta-lactamase superfamily hydrolase
VIPEFAEGREAQEREKAGRLAAAMETALARRKPPRRPPAGYTIDEQAELERARRTRGGGPADLRTHAQLARRQARITAQRLARNGLAKLVRGRSDRDLERRFGSRVAQQVFFAGMARSFRPRYAFGFQGEIQYELTSKNGGRVRPWTISIRDNRASARPGSAADPAVTVRVPTAELMRLAAGTTNPGAAVLQGKIEIKGDYSVAMRLVEMFGGPSPY